MATTTTTTAAAAAAAAAAVTKNMTQLQDSFREFPISPNSTPQITKIPFNHSFQSQSSHPSTSSATSCSSKGISSSLDTSFLREKQNVQENRYLQSAFREFEYWNETLDKIILQYWGPQSLQAARTMMELGACLLRCKQYSQALEVYKNAVVIYKHHHGQNSLSVAKGLDRIGFAATLCGSGEKLQLAEESLKEALRIRIEFLGRHHCDCVDTLNNIAGVYLQRKEYKIAKELYKEVLHVRSKIFGIHHASIAITAQMLGKIHFYLKDYENAMSYYDLALRVYRGTQMNLTEQHPLVRKVTKHLAATEKMILTEKRVQDSAGRRVK
jgi:tetratricopeptide (TPR) repeat protein